MEQGQYLFDAEQKAAFVLAYERSGEISAAAAAVRVSRTTVYKHLRDDPEFAEAVQQAEGRLYDEMMKQVKKLAIDGVEEERLSPTGKVIGKTKRYSERLLLAWLKRIDRRNWGDRMQVENTGEVTHTHRTLDPKKIPRAARNRLRDAFQALGEADDGDDPSRN